MSNVEIAKKDDGLVISLSGHIDSTNADAVENEIVARRKEDAGLAVVIDAAKLEYMSSAGLRILLRLRKTCPTLKMINVSPEVYEVLQMTGFTELIAVEKAYRHLSVDGCEVIGQGANGKVYRIDQDTIVKVYLNPDSLPDIKRETALARKAFVLGIPTAIPFDVVRVGDGYGSVFELLNAKSFAKLLIANPEKIDTYVQLYIGLLKTIHSTPVDPKDMPDMKQVAVNWAEFLLDYLPEKQGRKLVELIAAVPDRHTMIHGDYHIKNIMMQNDEVLLIDMDTLSYGHPVFELASMYLSYGGYSLCDHTVVEKFLGIPYDTAQTFWEKSLHLYLNTDEDTVEKIRRQAMLIGYTRLMRRTIRRSGDTAEGQQLIAETKKRLIELVDQTDSLDF